MLFLCFLYKIITKCSDSAMFCSLCTVQRDTFSLHHKVYEKKHKKIMNSISIFCWRIKKEKFFYSDGKQPFVFINITCVLFFCCFFRLLLLWQFSFLLRLNTQWLNATTTFYIPYDCRRDFRIEVPLVMSFRMSFDLKLYSV